MLGIYCRNSLTCSRRSTLEISSLETIWAEIELPNTIPFLVCIAYRPPNAVSEWIDLYEEELSIGLEYIVMGDFDIDVNTCTNTKWLNMIQLFDLFQLITESTLITPTTAKCKMSKKDHISASYRSFKHFDEDIFLHELSTDFFIHIILM